MHKKIIGFGALLLATTALAQTAEPALTVPLVGSSSAGDAEAAAQRAQSRAREAKQDEAETRERVEDKKRQADKEREASEERIRDQKQQAERERKASDERIAADQRATTAATQATRRAEAATAATTATAVPHAAAVPAKGDARSIAVDACMAEARSRGEAHGAHVTMRKVEDTDKMSDGRADVRAAVNVVTTANGKTKTRKETFKCQTRHGSVVKFKLS